MAKKISLKQPRALTARLTLDALLLHPICAKDSEPGQAGNSYDGWKLDHAGLTQFYVVGFGWLRAITQRREANYYHTFGAEAFEKARQLNWPDEIETDFRGPISYNQFRNALVLHKPMFFGHAAQVLLACELALADAIKKDRYTGDPMQVYDHIKVLPACFNIDGFNVDTLARMRQSFDGLDGQILAASGQSNPTLIEQLATGNCVTRKTARAIRSRTLELSKECRAPIIVGDVRGRPGARILGRKSASLSESIEFDDVDSYRDSPSAAKN